MAPAIRKTVKWGLLIVLIFGDFYLFESMLISLYYIFFLVLYKLFI